MVSKSARDNSVLVRRPIVVKSQVDENFKKTKKEELEKNLANAKEGHQKITGHLSTVPKEHVQDRRQLEDHLQKLTSQIAFMQYQLQTLNGLQPGEHFVELALDGFTSLKKGDNLRDKLGQLEIIIKNDIIQEITTATGV